MDKLKLLRLIERDGALSAGQLATLVGATEEEVAAAIAAWEEDKVILGRRTVIDWDRTSEELVTALIEVNVTPHMGEGYDRLAERLYQYDEVESVYLMSGSFDFTVILSGHTLKEVALFVGERLAPLKGVTKTSTHFILKKYKEKHLLFKKQEQQEAGFIFV